MVSDPQLSVVLNDRYELENVTGHMTEPDRHNMTACK